MFNFVFVFGVVVIGVGSWVILVFWVNVVEGLIKVGIVIDFIGLIVYVGNVDVNVVKMVIKEINGVGGLFGCLFEFYIEDIVLNELVVVGNVCKLI